MNNYVLIQYPNGKSFAAEPDKRKGGVYLRGHGFERRLVWELGCTLTPLLPLTPEIVSALRILLYGVQDWTGGDMTFDQAYEIVHKAIEGDQAR